MRDVLLFAVCCCLAVGYWVSSQRRYDQRSASVQTELYQLGAPQTMEDSAERSLLLGDFAKGLRSDPNEKTYARLAPLFLVSHDLKERKVLASAYVGDGMARVADKELQFFDPEGESLEPKLWTLGKTVAPLDRPLFEAAPSVTLIADGPWLVYADKKRWALFRFFGGELHGYISDKKLRVKADEVLVDGKKRWIWSQGQLESSTP